MGKEYAKLKKKLQNIESQLIPVLTSPSKPETPPFHQPITDKIIQDLHFMEKLIVAERMALSQAQTPSHAHHHDLGEMGRRVLLLKTTLRKWTEAQPTSTYVEHGSAPACSYSESCLDDSVDYDGNKDYDQGEEEDSPVVGFKVYDNPEFVIEDNEEEENGRGVVEDEDDEENVVDHDWIKQVQDEDEDEHEHEHEDEEEVEGKELIRVDSQMEARREAAEEDGDDDGTADNNCCYRTVFGVITVVMGITFVCVGFSDFADHASPLLLVPT